MNPLFSSSIVWYLFLGGAGSGAFVIASVIGLVLGRRDAAAMRRYRRLLDTGRTLGYCIVLLGVAFLVADLGRVDRAYTLFTQPTFSMASIGAYVILLFALSAAYPMAIRHLGLPRVSCRVTRAAEWTSVVFGIAVMTYTGMLLQSLWVVSFWASPLVCGFVLGPENAIAPLRRRVSCAVAVVEAIARGFLAPHARRCIGIRLG